MSTDIDKLTWRTRWVMRRNALLGSARFQRWASRTPFIRGIARRRAAAQFDLVAGFVYSQILVAMVESGLIEYLTGRLHSFDDVVAFLGFEPDAADRLLRAARALELVESPQAGLWTLGEQGAALSPNSGAMAMIRHHRLLYQDLADPLALLGSGRREETMLSAFWSYASRQKASGGHQTYSALMAATQPMVAQQIIDSYDFSRHRKMLDIGGGTGAFVSAVSSVAPRLAFGIFDLPEVLKGADASMATLHPGSFRDMDIPTGYDLITLTRIVHDHDDDVVQALLVKIRKALPPNGRLLIIEPMAGAVSAERMGDGYFGLYLWAMGSGRPRTAFELRSMLQSAGFSGARQVKTDLPVIADAIVATS
ncbi:MAG: methyltransferase [Sphingomonadaceae bacterium]|nr:methyltransferase [Sphingomonadaceae bacterium]